jgi:hypothetical protein
MAWAGAVFSWLSDNINLTLPFTATAFVATASIYSIFSQRSAYRHSIAHDAGTCQECFRHPTKIECPYPQNDRPRKCPHRYKV